jgi:hypothetical protein
VGESALTKATATATVKRWRADPERSGAARIGTRLLAGEQVGQSGAADAGVSPGMVGNVVRTLQTAGFTVEAERAGNAKLWRVTAEPGGRRARGAAVEPPSGRSRKVRGEVAGVTHPPLGATLLVRALALDERGDLLVHLSNGAGAWSARIVGHVEPEEVEP